MTPVIDIALSRGNDVDEPGDAGKTALGIACAAGRKDIIGYLASRGADPVRASTDCTPYLAFIASVMVVADGRFSRMRLDAVVDRLQDPWPLHSASQDDDDDDDDDDAILPLLTLGYAIDAPSDCCSVQPLHVAAKFGRTAVAAALLRAGADVNALATQGSKMSYHDGDRPLDIAREYDSTGVADLLVRHGGKTHRKSGSKRWWKSRSEVLPVMLKLLVAVAAILGTTWILPWMRARRADEAERELLRGTTAQDPRRRYRDAQAAARGRYTRRRDGKRTREAAAQARRNREAAAARASKDERREREASASARAGEVRERETAAARALDEKRARKAAAARAREKEVASAAARVRDAQDREAAAARAAAAAPAPEEKSEELPLGREESKADEAPAAPEG